MTYQGASNHQNSINLNYDNGSVFHLSFDAYVHGGGQPDSILGDDDHSYVDHLYGDAGNDSIHALAGADVVYGGSGADHLWGGEQDDDMYGDAGEDMMWDAGDTTDETLYDQIWGYSSSDTEKCRSSSTRWDGVAAGAGTTCTSPPNTVISTRPAQCPP